MQLAVSQARSWAQRSGFPRRKTPQLQPPPRKTRKVRDDAGKREVLASGPGPDIPRPLPGNPSEFKMNMNLRAVETKTLGRAWLKGESSFQQPSEEKEELK